MSVLIKGMEMPSCCMFCPVSNSSGCGLTNPPIIMTSKEMLAGRPDFCPLVPVPPHGRLIDADALCEYCNNVIDHSVTPNDIMRFPTIIPASEEGE